MKKLVLLSLTIFVVTILGIITIYILNQAKSTNKLQIDTKTPITSAKNGKYTMADIEIHNSQSSCWMIIDKNIYDVTTYVPNHPGMDILKGCGKDATIMFESIKKHRGVAQAMLDNYLIGTL